MTAAQYDESVRKLEAAGVFPPDGLDYHVCFGTDGNLRVSEIWVWKESVLLGVRQVSIEIDHTPGRGWFRAVHASASREA